jgi:hypothetical protein
MKKDTVSTEMSGKPKPIDWPTIGLYVVPYLVMLGIALALLPQTIAAHMASEVWVTICAAFGIK